MEVVLIDAGGANIGSVRYAFERLGANARFSADPAVIAAADRVVLPGVGAAAAAMARLHELGLESCVHDLRQPLLGVCLGMQLLFDSSEEGDVDCIGLLPGRVRKLQGHFAMSQKDVEDILVSSSKLTRRGAKIEALELEAEGGTREASDQRAAVDNRVGQLRLRVVDED